MTDNCPEASITEGRPGVPARLNWVLIGSATLDAHGRLVFPPVTSVPGLYRFELLQGGCSSFYTGQADNLSRRFQHYRTPGRSQQTNLRLNRLMTDMLASGGHVSVSVITECAAIDARGESRSIDLASKAERVSLEAVAVTVANATGFQSLNRQWIRWSP